MPPIAWRDLRSYIARLGRLFWRKFRRHGFAVIIIFCLTSTLLDWILPVIGRVYIPSRRSQQPRLPYGLSLVDVNIDSLYAVSINADVVFVHGLGAYPDSTWQKRNKHGSMQGASQSQVSWIRDLLPEDIPNTRLLFFNYDSTTYNDAPQKNLEDIAQELLHAFQITRLRATPIERVRPIIFLCHSYGGLVVKEALVQAATKHDDHRDIADNTKGVIFLGTPHRGTEYSEYARKVALRLNRIHSNPDIFLALEVNSPYLNRQHERFLDRFGNLKIFNFYETRATPIFTTPVWRFHYSVILVNKSSATFEAQNSKNIPIDNDHSGLNKYSSRNEIGYESVQGTLWLMVKEVYEQNRVSHLQIGNSSQIAEISACPPSANHIVPLQTVRSYTDRPLLTAELSSMINAPFGDRDPPRSVALWGLNGMGKTQLALRYIEENRELYNVVIWINAQSQTATLSSFESAFEALGLEHPMHVLDQLRRGKGAFDPPASNLRGNWLVAEVLNYLEHRSRTSCRWLMVIDNADDLQWLHDIMPRGRMGAVLITSNDRYVSRFTNYAIHVDKLNTNEAVSLLTRSAQIEIGDLNTTKGASRWRQQKMQEALAIVNQLDHIAIAVDAAGAYIAQHDHVRESPSLYLDYFDDNSNSLLIKPRPNVEDRYQLTIATVWETSLNAVNRSDPNSASLLTIFGQLNGLHIEDNLFVEASRSLNDSAEAFWRGFALFLQVTAYYLLPFLFVHLILSFSTWNRALADRVRYKIATWLTFMPLLVDVIGMIILHHVRSIKVRQGNTVSHPYSWILDTEVRVVLIWMGCNCSVAAIVEWIWPYDSRPWFSAFPWTYGAAVGIFYLLDWLQTGLDERISGDAEELLHQLDFSHTSMTRFMKVVAAIHKVSGKAPGWGRVLDIAWEVFWGMLLKLGIVLGSEIISMLWALSVDKLCRMALARHPHPNPRWRILIATLEIAKSRLVFFCIAFICGFVVGFTGIPLWIPWRHKDDKQIVIPPDLINSLVSPRRMDDWDPRLYSEAMAPLTRYGIVHRTPDSSYSMHSLVKWWICHRIPPAHERSWAREALRFVRIASFSKTCWSNTTCQRLLVPHLVELANTEVQFDDPRLSVLRFLLKMLYRCLKKIDAAYAVGPEDI